MSERMKRVRRALATAAADKMLHESEQMELTTLIVRAAGDINKLEKLAVRWCTRVRERRLRGSKPAWFKVRTNKEL